MYDVKLLLRLAMAGTGDPLDPQLSSAISVPGAFACLSLVLQSLCDFFSPSSTIMDLSDWAFFVCW